MAKDDKVDMGWFECIFPMNNKGGLRDPVAAARDGSSAGADGGGLAVPMTFTEALAMLRGEGAVKPDFERVATTVGVAMAGGYYYGWRQGRAMAASYPAHQSNLIRRRAALAKGTRFTLFALIYEGSVTCLEALRQKNDFLGGAVGGALAGTAFGVPGGVASAGRGLFVGTWLGALFGALQIRLAQLKTEVLLADSRRKTDEEEAERRMELEKEAALAETVRSLEIALESWPGAEKPAPPATPEPVEDVIPDPRRNVRRRWWALW